MKFVHIGFPKTGTTFLQTAVFPRLEPEFLYFDKAASAPFFEPLIHHDDTIFDAMGLRRRLENAWRGRERVIFSYEPLTGLHHQTGFVNRSLIARRLRSMGFVRAIITIRNQFDILESAYKQYVKSGGVLGFDEYVGFEPGARRWLYPEYFDYYSIYRLYAETFGAANVLVLQHEHMRKSSFVRNLCGALDVPPFDVPLGHRVNPSLSFEKTRILRVLNHFTFNSYRPAHLVSRRLSTSFFHRSLARLPVLEKRRSFVTETHRAAIAAFYRASNDALRREGIPLAPDYP